MTTSTRGSLAPYESAPLQRLLQRTARRFPNKLAVIDGDRRFTYAQLDQYSDRFAAALASMGVAKGDRVGVLAPNCVEFEISFFGIIKAGAVVTTVNSGYREREIAHQLDSAGAEVLVLHHSLQAVADSARDAVPALKRMIVIEEDAPSPESFWGLIEGAPAAPPRVSLDPEQDLAVLPYSSGTTGLSKGVMLTHFNLAANVCQFLQRDEPTAIREADVVMVHLPLFHIYGMNVLMNPAIAAGATQVLMGRFDVDQFLGLLARHRVTALYTVPPVGLALTQYPNIGSFDLSALRFSMFGAAPMSAEMQTRVQEAVGCPIIQGYGLTETSPVTNQDFIDPERGRPGSVGPGMPDTEEMVVDVETGQLAVPFGEPGELLIRGPQVMKGYFDNPVATTEAITPDGWLHTGDIVRMDHDGYVWILDRKKELIKYKGFQVPPAELEGLLLEHPAAADVAVIAKPDPEAGEVPKAFVVVRPGASVTPGELMAFVAERVATFKHIREVEFVDAIPKNPSGKILRRVLVDQERARAADHPPQ